jgi:hypothetical protein
MPLDFWQGQSYARTAEGSNGGAPAPAAATPVGRCGGTSRAGRGQAGGPITTPETVVPLCPALSVRTSL